MKNKDFVRRVKLLPVLFLLLSCNSSTDNDTFKSRMDMLMRQKDSLVRLRAAEERNLTAYEKEKPVEILLNDTAYLQKAETVVSLDQKINFVTHEIRQLEKERLANQEQKK